MKSRYVAALLAFFLGGFGVHKFYLGKWIGILYFILCWTYIPSIIALIEGILYLVNSEAEFNRKYNKGKGENANKNNQDTISNSQTNQKYTYPDSNTTLSKICPKCGKQNDLDSNFCELCGGKLN